MSTTNALTGDLRKDIATTFQMIGALRDEIRLKAHLLGMEARSEWDRLEPRVAEAERLASEASHATKSALEWLVSDLRHLVTRTDKELGTSEEKPKATAGGGAD